MSLYDDGSKVVCSVDAIKSEHNNKMRPLNVVSIGSKNWIFEVAAAKLSKRVRIHTYDCTLWPREPHIPPSISKFTHFHRICADAADATVKSPMERQ